jgi:hypothetical protein
MTVEKVWVVVSGYYSDQEIVTAFSTQEAARLFIAEKEDYHFSECGLDVEPIPAPHPDGLSWAVNIASDGKTYCSQTRPHQGPPTCRPNPYPLMDGTTWWKCFLRAHSQEQAIKIAADEVAKAKAQLAGIG